MHIGLVTHFDVSQITGQLKPFYKPKARVVRGRTNSPVTNLLPAYLEAGFRVSIFAAEKTVDKPTEFHGNNLSVYLVPHRRNLLSTKMDSFRKERRALVDSIKRVNPDIVHGQWTHTGHSLAALDSGWPCVITIHDAAMRAAWLNRGLRPSIIMHQMMFLLDTLKVIYRAGTLIGVSPYTIEHIRRFFCYQRDAHVIPNGQEIFDNQDMIGRNRVKFNPDKPVFIDISQWGRLKNVKMLLKAFKRFRKEKPKAKLLLYGYGLEPVGPGYTWARKYGYAKGVEFRGYVQTSVLNRALAQEADIFIHLSHTETWGMTICEAALQGLPIIVGNCGGIPWMLSNSSRAEFVNPCSLADAVRAMGRVCDNFDQYCDGMERLQKRIRNDYCPKNIVKQLAMVYKKLI